MYKRGPTAVRCGAWLADVRIAESADQIVQLVANGHPERNPMKSCQVYPRPRQQCRPTPNKLHGAQNSMRSPTITGPLKVDGAAFRHHVAVTGQ